MERCFVDAKRTSVVRGWSDIVAGLFRLDLTAAGGCTRKSPRACRGRRPGCNQSEVARHVAATLRPLYGALGLTVGCVTQPLDPTARQRTYACDIAYCTAKELVFDYLRDWIIRGRVLR